MKLFQHKHKFVCRKEIQTRLDEMDLDKVQGRYDWNDPMQDMKYDYVVLDCVCKKCEVAGKARAFPVMQVIKDFQGGYEALESFLSQPMSIMEESLTRNSPDYWEGVIKIHSQE